MTNTFASGTEGSNPLCSCGESGANSVPGHITWRRHQGGHGEDIPGLSTITDPELVNPWGVWHTPISPFWVSHGWDQADTQAGSTDFIPRCVAICGSPEPSRLREVIGIGPKRAERIIAGWAEQKVIRETMLFLHSTGLH
jgi:hypothetical protein